MLLPPRLFPRQGKALTQHNRYSSGGRRVGLEGHLPAQDVGAGGGRQLFAHLPSSPQGPVEVCGGQAGAVPMPVPVPMPGGAVPRGSAEAVAVAGV